MSNEPYNDDTVSQAYRSLASEKTPAHLDRKILEMAAAEAQQPRYSRWMAWSRPLAWAATITLCLAITLELMREPALDSAPPKEEAALQESEYVLRKRQPDDSPEVLADAIIADKTALGRSSARQPVAEAVPAARVRQSTDEYVAAPETAAVEEMLVAAEAEEPKAKQTNAGVRADAPAAAMSSMTYATNVVADVDAELEECTAEIRAEPETWLDCILELEDAGNTEAGERHRDALIDTFPDFKLP